MGIYILPYDFSLRLTGGLTMTEWFPFSTPSLLPFYPPYREAGLLPYLAAGRPSQLFNSSTYKLINL